ncbi:PD-(D/E)XK motif protein [Aquirufa sp. 5-AUSEE-100C1]
MENVVSKFHTKNEIVSLFKRQNELNHYDLLSIKFSSDEEIHKLFLPKLKYLYFVLGNNELMVHINDESLIDYFSKFIYIFYSQLEKKDSTVDLIKKFNNSIRDLIKLGEKNPQISINSARGLFGELKYLEELLLERESRFYRELIDSWHRPSPANHDFSFEKIEIEIKTISKKNTTIKITSEYQLESQESSDLYLVCYRLDNINNSLEDSLGKLYSNIIDMLKSEGLDEMFATKCSMDEINYLGPSLTPLNYKFVLIEKMKFLVDQNEFPRIRRSNLDIGISDVNYSVDISMLEKFKI